MSLGKFLARGHSLSLEGPEQKEQKFTGDKKGKGKNILGKRNNSYKGDGTGGQKTA